MPFFSVIIPTYNRGQLIRETLESVFRQEETSFEVIVVDDGSTDDTLEVLQGYASRIQILQQPNAGPGAARNRAAAQAKGKYLAFLDSDDLWFPWTLAVYRTVIEEHSDPNIITSVPLECAIDFVVPFKPPSELRCTSFRDYFSSHRRHRTFGSGLTVVRRDTFLNIQGYAAEFVNAEDLDFMLRFGNSVGFVEIDRPHLVAWRQHDNNLTRNLASTGDGLTRIINRELAGEYPGGAERRRERRGIISRHVRPHSLSCLKSERWRAGLAFYRQTVLWNLRERRLRYLLAFPFLTAAGAARALWRSRATPNRRKQQCSHRIES